MRALKIVLLALALCALAAGLGGCGMSDQVENQAYGIVIGLDRTQDGQMRMNARIPKISGEEQSGGAQEGASSSGYALLDVRGESFDAALEKLNWAAPRDLNLSHLKLIVLSGELAREPQAADLIERIAQTEHLFNSACIAICEGSACDFVAALEPGLGVRLSSDVEASLEHHASLGFIPDVSLADLYYLSGSVYSDPLAVQVLLRESGAATAQEENAPAFAFDGSAEALSGDDQSDVPTRYLGAAVFVDGRMRGSFTPRQTVMSSLLNASLSSLHYNLGPQSLILTPVRAPDVSVDLSSEAPVVRVELLLSLYTQARNLDEDALRAELEADIQDVFQAAQRMGAEPFGFAECAARHFLTMDEWLEYGWRERFRRAELELDIRFFRTDA